MTNVVNRAVREMPGENEVWKHRKLRSSKYLNNLIERDNRPIKSRTGPMLGFRRFDYAAITIAGVELLRVFRKDNSPSNPYASKTKVRALSGTLSFLRRSIFSKTSFCPLRLFEPEPLTVYSIAGMPPHD
jgi:DDE domain